MAKLTTGVIIPIITPYCFSDLFPLIDHLIVAGISKIFLLGTTGEALQIQHNQKKELIRQAAFYIGGRAQLLVGITSRSLEESIELMHLAHDSGAIASVIAPLVLDANCPHIIEKLLSSSPGNLLLYNYPRLSNGAFIPIEEIAPFFSEERVLGIKDSSGNFPYFDQLLKEKDEQFLVFYGSENHLSEALEKQIDGFVPGSGNIEPHTVCALWEKKQQGPWKQWMQLKEAIKERDEGNYIVGIKRLLKENGWIKDDSLFPNLPLAKEEQIREKN